MPFIEYKYKFIFSNEKTFEHTVILEQTTFSIISNSPSSYPEWTKLEFNKCPVCILDINKTKFCPIAINLIPLINFFSTLPSYQEVDVIVETPQRIYSKHTSLQKGLSSLIGIYMCCSGCPILDKLRPLVKFHLPFANSEETTFRVVSMHLLAQYFLFKKGEKPDLELKNLYSLYEQIKKVNKKFCDRINYAIKNDASVNAVIILNCFAEGISLSIEKSVWKDIKKLLENYYLT